MLQRHRLRVLLSRIYGLQAAKTCCSSLPFSAKASKKDLNNAIREIDFWMVVRIELWVPVVVPWQWFRGSVVVLWRWFRGVVWWWFDVVPWWFCGGLMVGLWQWFRGGGRLLVVN